MSIWDGPLRYPERADAFHKAAQLTIDTALVWQVEYHPDTARFHVVLDRLAVQHVTPQAARDVETLSGRIQWP